MAFSLDKLRERYVAGTPHMRAIGLEVTDLAPGRGAMRMPAHPDWLGDPVRGLLHPGPLTVLADSTFGLAVSSTLEKPAPIATLDLRMDYLRPAGPERDVFCEARCFRRTRNVAFVDAEVWQDDRDQPIAIGRSAFMLSTPTGKRPAEPGGVASTAHAPEPKLSPDAPPWSAPADSEPVMAERPIPYAAFLGIRESMVDGQPLYRMPYQERHIGNPYLPALHGGVVAGFSETAGLLHVIHSLRGAKFPKSVDFSIDYLRAGRPEETFAACEIVRVGSRVALVQIRCWQRSPDYPITVSRAHFLLTEPDDPAG
jgi:uncharacterized protein (TIGR00369 family)